LAGRRWARRGKAGEARLGVARRRAARIKFAPSLGGFSADKNLSTKFHLLRREPLASQFVKKKAG
jgi:hypothetical protein